MHHPSDWGLRFSFRLALALGLRIDRQPRADARANQVDVLRAQAALTVYEPAQRRLWDARLHEDSIPGLVALQNGLAELFGECLLCWHIEILTVAYNIGKYLNPR